jgi:hypothetical protein
MCRMTYLGQFFRGLPLTSDFPPAPRLALSRQFQNVTAFSLSPIAVTVLFLRGSCGFMDKVTFATICRPVSELAKCEWRLCSRLITYHLSTSSTESIFVLNATTNMKSCPTTQFEFTHSGLHSHLLFVTYFCEKILTFKYYILSM